MVRSILNGHFASALLGAVVALAAAGGAAAGGLVEVEREAAATAPAPLPARHGGGAGAAGSTPVGEIYERASAGVAFVEAERPVSTPPLPGQPPGGAATGSGFVIDQEGHVLTNSHVVEGAEEVRVTLGDSETPLEADVVGTDPATDVALLAVDAPADELRPLPLGRSAEVRVGDPVIAIGNPFGLDRTVTTGIVSALQRQIQAPNGFAISDVIQTDASINPGNSGGPLLDSAGRVVGINSQIESAGGGSDGVGFAVPVDTARRVVAQLLEDGSAEHAFLGLSGAGVDAALAESLNLSAPAGVLVQEVAPGGPADRAGLRGGETEARLEGIPVRLGGDLITAIDGRPVGSMEDVVDAVNAARPGDRVELAVLRDDRERTVTVELGERPAAAAG